MSARRSDGSLGHTNGLIPAFMEDPLRACRGVDPEVFYPVNGASLKEARDLCSSCLVLDECREWGIRHENIGLWGGLSATQRRDLRMSNDPTTPITDRLREARRGSTKEGDLIAFAVLSLVKKLSA